MEPANLVIDTNVVIEYSEIKINRQRFSFPFKHFNRIPGLQLI